VASYADKRAVERGDRRRPKRVGSGRGESSCSLGFRAKAAAATWGRPRAQGRGFIGRPRRLGVRA
jgi:hypothetical protein